jgi:hypothetical protein
MTCLFIYDFFQDGRWDVLREVRILQRNGLWTPEKRTSWTKEAIAAYHRLKHAHQYQGASYFAGRIAALKSRQTASFSQPQKRAFETRDTIIYRPLSLDPSRFCGLFDCGDEAIWGVCLWGDKQPFVVLCDRCRQEWERANTAYTTASGWDWDDDEELALMPLTPSRSHKLALIKEDVLALGQTVLPLAFLVGFNVSNILWPTSHLVMITQLIIVAGVHLQSVLLIRLLFWLHAPVEGNDL